MKKAKLQILLEIIAQGNLQLEKHILLIEEDKLLMKNLNQKILYYKYQYHRGDMS